MMTDEETSKEEDEVKTEAEVEAEDEDMIDKIEDEVIENIAKNAMKLSEFMDNCIKLLFQMEEVYIKSIEDTMDITIDDDTVSEIHSAFSEEMFSKVNDTVDILLRQARKNEDYDSLYALLQVKSMLNEVANMSQSHGHTEGEDDINKTMYKGG